MKKILCLFFSLFLLCFTGCTQEIKFNEPVRFYYPNAAITYGSDSGAFSYEQREGETLSAEEILSLYLNGPLRKDLRSPFLDNTQLISLQISGEEVSLVLNDQYAELAGLELSIANACLAKTAMELTGAATAVLSCESTHIAGEPCVTITQQQLILFDESTGASQSDPLQTTAQ